jgi:hypothetical protein
MSEEKQEVEQPKDKDVDGTRRPGDLGIAIVTDKPIGDAPVVTSN